MVGADIKIQKIHHRAETQPIDEIAHRASGDQADGVGKNPALLTTSSGVKSLFLALETGKENERVSRIKI